MRRVLIVDDEPIIVQGLVSVLSESGLDIDLYSAYSGEEALALLSETRMDIVISDVHMPGMDGLETARLLLQRHPDARIVMISSLAYDDTIDEAKRIGTLGFVYKPFDGDQVLLSINNAFSA